MTTGETEKLEKLIEGAPNPGSLYMGGYLYL